MAGREIKTTLAVDGEQAFKRSINDAKTSIRNLGTQLSLAQAEFKRDGDAMKLMETRSKTLKAEITAQKEIVKALEGAVKDATKEFGEGSTQAEKWEAELNRAKTAMASLEVELRNNENGLDRNGTAFDDASTKASEFSDAVNGISRNVSFDTITSGIGSITSGFKGAIEKATELATSMWNMMRDAASWADDEITLASVYGITTDELQRMQYAAKVVDTDVDTLIKSREKLKTAMGNWDNQSIAEAFQSVRVPVLDTNGNKRDPDTVFWEVGAALMNMTDEVEQSNVAMQLFGKSWMELRPMFSAGKNKYDNALADATVIPQENLEKLGALQDQLDKLDTEFQALKMNVLSELAPAFEVLAGALTDLMGEFNAYLQTDEGKEMMQSLQEAVSSFFEGLKDIDFHDAVNTVSGALEGIQGSFDWIKNNKDGILTALGAIAGGFGLLNLASVGLNIAKTISGFKTLFGGGSGGSSIPSTSHPTGNQGIVGGGSSAAAGGGIWAAIGNKLTGAASTGSTFLAQSGMLPGVLVDMFLNQTNTGRSLRDGGSLWSGIVKDVTGTIGNVAKNAETIEEDWANNNLVRLAGIGGARIGEVTTGAFRTQKEASEWILDDSATAEDAMAFVAQKAEEAAEIIEDVDLDEAFSAEDKDSAVQDWWDAWRENAEDEGTAFDWMQEVFGDDFGDVWDSIVSHLDELGDSQTDLEDLPSDWWSSLLSGVDPSLYTGTGTGAGSGNGGLTSQDIDEFTKVPDSMVAAVKQGISGIEVKMDRYTVGNLLAPVVSEYIASEVQ